MPIVELPDLAAFTDLQELLLARAMPEFKQIVCAPPGLLGEDEIEWLAENDVELRDGPRVPEGKVFVFREART